MEKVTKKYNIIYADPPWSYKGTKLPKGHMVMPYSVMTLEDIKRLPVRKIAAENCILFLWVTFPKLQEGLEVIKAWGFEYKTLGFSWIKLNKKNNEPWFGIGYYTKSNSEVCLLATKGKGHSLVKSNKVSSVIITPREEHSKKPDIARNRIVELCGDIPRIELFARQKVDGWDVWGNEIENDIELK